MNNFAAAFLAQKQIPEQLLAAERDRITRLARVNADTAVAGSGWHAAVDALRRVAARVSPA